LACGCRGGGQGRDELAGGQGVEGAEAASKFELGQFAFAEERAEKVVGAALAFLGVAFPTARDQVAVRIVARLRARHDMVETPRRWRVPLQTIETTPALTRMDGLTQGIGAQEVLLFQVDNDNRRGVLALVVFGMVREDLFGQAHFRDVTAVAAFDQA
jgi:hypothetical protein